MLVAMSAFFHSFLFYSERGHSGFTGQRRQLLHGLCSDWVQLLVGDDVTRRAERHSGNTITPMHGTCNLFMTAFFGR